MRYRDYVAYRALSRDILYLFIRSDVLQAVTLALLNVLLDFLPVDFEVFAQGKGAWPMRSLYWRVSRCTARLLKGQ